ncbi:MAG: hypothetical protein OXI92_07665 [Acidobacteriota bacterium]|nr:hypothetical protein [Acidobacteriota bacterium]
MNSTNASTGEMSRTAQSARTAWISAAAGAAKMLSSSTSRSMASTLTAVTARPAAIMSVWVPASEPIVHSTDTSPFRSVAAVEGSTRPLPGAGRKFTVTPATG